MLAITNNLTSLDLPLNSILVNYIGLSSVKKYLYLCSENIPPVNYSLEAFELCLTCSNSIFNNENYL